MNKDVKSASVLSQGMRGTTPPSQPQPKNLLLQPQKPQPKSLSGGYVHVPGAATAAGNSARGASNDVRGLGAPSKEVSTDNSAGRGFMDDQKSTLHPVLSSLGFSADEINALLRSELLASRAGGRHEGDLADWKHKYIVATNAAFSTTEATVAVAGIAGGTTVDTRTGASIRLHKLRIKLTLDRFITGVASSAQRDNTYWAIVWRDKIPVTPGTAPTLHGTDSNPPSSGTLMLSQLGAATAQGVDNMVLNPITQDAYHIYELRRLKFNTIQGYTYTGTTLGMPAPQTEFIEFNIDLHGVQQKYPSYASSASDINNLWFTLFADNAVNSGVNETFSWSSDLEFEDMMDAV